ncbi:thioredoxin family protein [Flavobacterium sp. ANB]|uniref:thioredoxin family protein n=1 Tax=unclassified Flavobacterium TaxID=196869 RepID=UPI0012B7F8F0|nr:MULTISPECIES: thioredoxin family protein [unclassified Flavobacterium]MBF4514924.1 thioredoxin family protein [Flavobacterium sp. ANB]MTD68250.1 thioredoxin family protein [Flavobacterium sp. LC2016-13]
MTKKLLILLFFLGSLLVESQNLTWNTDVSTAIALSNEQRKPLLIFFTTKETSDKIQNEIFKTSDFQSWSAKNVVLVKLDLSDTSVSDSVRDQNLSLKDAFGIDQLPQVCFATASIRKGKTNFGLLGKLGYKSGNVQAWIYESDLILNPE